MEMSTIFSQNTQERLNNAPFEQLDAAETRLSGYDLHLAYLLDHMTPETRHVVNYLNACSAAGTALEYRPFREVTPC